MHTHSTELWASHLALESSLCRPVDVEPALSLSVWMTEHLPSRYPNCCACRTCVAAPPSIDAPQLLLLLHVLCLTSSHFVLENFTKGNFHHVWQHKHACSQMDAPGVVLPAV